MTKKLLLPQHDQKDKQKRARYLEKQRQLYEYAYKLKGNIARLKLPEYVEKPQSIYLKLIYTLRAFVWWWPKRVPTNFEFLFKSAVRWTILVPLVLFAWLKMLIKGFPFKKIEDYFLYSFYPYPFKHFIHNFDNDVYLGLQRVAGVNPTLIEGLTPENPLPEAFQAKEVVKSLTHQSYEEALQDGRLYITDYSVLQTLADNPGKLDGDTKYCTTPIALYYRQDDGLLKPLAIQLYAKKTTSSENPVFTPANGNHWLMAKAYAQSADANLQDTWIHATFIHFVMEGIILGTYRNLAYNHPLYALLYPHTKVTLLLNNLFPFFDPPPTPLTRLFASDQDTTVAFVGQGMREYNFKEQMFPNDIKRRNVEDPKLFYPYRDDGQLVWDTIYEFVDEYIRLYYKSDQDVLEDFELQAWGDEIGGSLEEKKFDIPGFPTQFTTIEQLIETIANIIFIVSAKHNCINYSQFQYHTFMPNNPFAIYVPPITDLNRPIFKEDLIELLSPNKLTTFTQTFLFFLTGFKINRLGEYPLGKFDDQAKKVIQKFQQKLKEVSKEVETRNRDRDFPYTLMDPANIPNSITA